MTTAALFSRLILATESYGGHYGPAFVTYFDSQNTLIAGGSLSGVKITVSGLMINKYVPSLFLVRQRLDPFSTLFLLPFKWMD